MSRASLPDGNVHQLFFQLAEVFDFLELLLQGRRERCASRLRQSRDAATEHALADGDDVDGHLAEPLDNVLIDRVAVIHFVPAHDPTSIGIGSNGVGVNLCSAKRGHKAEWTAQRASSRA
jgi:hypothetical protein